MAFSHYDGTLPGLVLRIAWKWAPGFRNSESEPVPNINGQCTSTDPGRLIFLTKHQYASGALVHPVWNPRVSLLVEQCLTIDSSLGAHWNGGSHSV